MKISLVVDKNTRSKLTHDVEVNRYLADAIEQVIYEREIEELERRISTLELELPRMRAEYSRLSVLQREAEEDLRWINERQAHLSLKNKELLSMLGGKKK